MNNIYRLVFQSIGVLGAGSGIFGFLRESGTASEIAELISAVFAGVNILAIIWFTWKKNKGEVKKLDVDSDSEIVDAAQTNLEGAKLVTTMLKEQIDELRKELENEKKARREDAEYFKRRIKEIEQELQDYRLYAARLAKQVIESGDIPAPLISSNGDDKLLETINKERGQLRKAASKREEELKNAGSDK